MFVWFSNIEKYWHTRFATHVASNLLILGFLVGLLFASMGKLGFINFQGSFFIAVDIAFTALLIIEAMGLIFVLPRSVADSVGKQFEILSIVLLRSAFKEFGHQYEHVGRESFYDPAFYHMFYDAFGALIIFFLLGFYYKIQMHEKITYSDQEQQDFVRFKQLVAMGLLVVFLGLGIYDLEEWLRLGIYEPSINTFYFILIFADVLILLYSLRYTSKYYNIFRYSSFAFATILIRLSLSANPPINSLLGILAVLFLLGISYAYNYFRSSVSGISKPLPTEKH
ncbi:MAG: hypothetical protein ACLFUB_09380 [Cyclobacteriaceae bacterium]